MSRLVLALSACLALALPSVGAATTRILTESDVDAPGGQEVFHITFASPSDMADNKIGASGFTPLDVDPAYSIRDFAYDGAYRVLLESNADRPGGDEVRMLTYANWQDLTTNTIASAVDLPIDIDPAFAIGGFTFDGAGYQMLLQSRVYAGAQSLKVLDFAGLDHLMSATVDDSFFIPLDFGPHPAVGLAYSPGGYSLMLDYDHGQPSPYDFFLWGLGDYKAMKEGGALGGYPPPLTVAPGFSFRGLEYEQDFPPPGIPEPATWTVMIAGFGLAGAALRAARRRMAAAAQGV